MICAADVVIDPYRPGVLERLGLGPELFLGDGRRKGLNEKLIYARLVGYVLIVSCGPAFRHLSIRLNRFPRTGMLEILSADLVLNLFYTRTT